MCLQGESVASAAHKDGMPADGSATAKAPVTDTRHEIPQGTTTDSPQTVLGNTSSKNAQMTKAKNETKVSKLV